MASLDIMKLSLALFGLFFPEEALVPKENYLVPKENNKFRRKIGVQPKECLILSLGEARLTISLATPVVLNSGSPSQSPAVYCKP